VTRIYWQQLAEDRLSDAEVLLQNQRWAAAFYLAGYAVECGLKACVLVRLANNPEVIFETRQFDCWIHDIEALVRRAGLESVRLAATQADNILERNWNLVRTWREDSRYRIRTEPEARDFFNAVFDSQSGVMTWVRKYW
jgi:HEPN domain-containing protein